MSNLFQSLSMLGTHPQPIAFIFLKFFGITFTKYLFSIKRNGYKLNLENNQMSLSLFHKGKNINRGFEILLERLLKKGDNFIDVGGSIGFHSIYAKRIVESGSVVMIEPMPELVETASRNFNLNSLQIELLPMAITDNSSSVEMADLEGRSYIFDELKNLNEENTPTIVNNKGFSNEFEDKLTIPSCTLDSICEKFDHISLIKIDTEGAELSTIKSGMRSLYKIDSFVVGLFNPYTTSRFGYEAFDAANLLIENGFHNAYRISDGPKLSLSPLNMQNEKFDSTDYYLFSKLDIASFDL
tara:strand:- start:393 stop:1286 length:894 start_codon:yes stop_codon:yes gene_type:complete